MSDARSPLDERVTLDLEAFGAPSPAQLAGVVLELASQLHAERVRRIALETALEAAGVLPADAPLTAEQRAIVRAKGGAALGRSMSGLMRVITEGADPRTPLRREGRSDP